MMDMLTEELSFIKKGQTWAIVGESGSGHSELLERIYGNTVERVSFKHNFRTLSHTTDFYYQQRFNSCDSEDSLTLQQHLDTLTTENQSGSWTSDKVISKLHLEHLLDEQLIKLSNGETKRLLIASALIKNPEILILDHPLTGLDVNTRKEFGNLIKDIVNSGIVVLMASDPLELPDAITHVAVMNDGKIIHMAERNDFKPADFHFLHTVEIDLPELKELISFHQSASFNTILQMKDVTVEYDGRKILDHINWHVKQGERWSLSGPNGAGKSTLLSLVNGDNPQAYANDIILFDRKRGSGESIWDIKKQTGFVSPELYQYFPSDSSCLHIIESGFYDTVGLFRPTDPAKENVCLRWMNLMHISQYANKLFSMIPASAQRLCLLARALVKNPTLLILDEPTQGLDSSQQQFFTQLVDEICSNSNVTVIYVSHYEHHIPEAVNKRLKLDNGKVVI